MYEKLINSKGIEGRKLARALSAELFSRGFINVKAEGWINPKIYYIDVENNTIEMNYRKFTMSFIGDYIFNHRKELEKKPIGNLLKDAVNALNKRFKSEALAMKAEFKEKVGGFFGIGSKKVDKIATNFVMNYKIGKRMAETY